MDLWFSRLSRDRLQGVHPDLVRRVERAIQITTQDFRVVKACARVGARPSWLRAAPAGPCIRGISQATPSIWWRLDGEISWQWEDYFRVEASMQASVS